jgi:hypothetical protein
MNLNKSWEVSLKKKRTNHYDTNLKRKVKCHYTKRDDGVSKISKIQNNYLFLFFANKFLLFSIFKMNVKRKLCWEVAKTLQRNATKIKRRKVRDKENIIIFPTFCHCSLGLYTKDHRFHLLFIILLLLKDLLHCLSLKKLLK